MKKTTYLALMVGLAGLMARPASATPWVAITGNRTVLLLPARERIVQLGFDLLSIRPRLLLITYQGSADSDDAGMHVWHGGKWLRLSDADYEAGRFLKEGAVLRQMYLVGTEQDVPWVLQYRPTWADEMHWIQSLQVTDLVNVLGERFRFTREEWTDFAGWHNLRLFETTVKQRRVLREDTWPTVSADEARRPILERVRRDPPSTVTPPLRPVPARAERQPWVEVPMDTPPADAPRPSAAVVPAPPPPSPTPSPPPPPEPEVPLIDALPLIEDPPAAKPPAVKPDMPAAPAVPPVPEPRPALPAIDAPPIPSPEPPAPAPEPEPAVEPDPEPAVPAIPEKDVLPPRPVAPSIPESVQDTIPVEDAVPAPESPPRPPQPPSLTPEEIEFFELIRREFPDLDGLPGMP